MRRAKDRKELADFLAKTDEIGACVITRLGETTNNFPAISGCNLS